MSEFEVINKITSTSHYADLTNYYFLSVEIFVDFPFLNGDNPLFKK